MIAALPPQGAVIAPDARSAHRSLAGSANDAAPSKGHTLPHAADAAPSKGPLDSTFDESSPDELGPKLGNLPPPTAPARSDELCFSRPHVTPTVEIVAALGAALVLGLIGGWLVGRWRRPQ